MQCTCRYLAAFLTLQIRKSWKRLGELKRDVANLRVLYQ